MIRPSLSPDLILNALGIFISVCIGILVYLSARLIGRVQTEQGIRSTWVEVDRFLLDNPTDLAVVDAIYHPTARDRSEAAVRKRWLCHLIRNPLENMYISANAGLVKDRAHAQESLRRCLEPLVADDDFFDLVRFSDNQEFANLCAEIRSQRAEVEAQLENVRVRTSRGGAGTGALGLRGRP